MLAKRDKTENACMDAVMAYQKCSTMMPEMLEALSGFLYAPETDRADRLMNNLLVILYKAAERAADTLDSMPRRPRRGDKR